MSPHHPRKNYLNRQFHLDVSDESRHKKEFVEISDPGEGEIAARYGGSMPLQCIVQIVIPTLPVIRVNS